MNLHSFRDLEQKFPRKKVDLPNGETLSYVDCNCSALKKGEEPPEHTVVVIPGYACDSRLMAYTLAQFGAFQDHRIISIDPRGYGESSLNQPNWCHKENAEDMKLVLDALEIQTPIMMMGYSTGAGAAAWLSLLYPERVKVVWMVSGLPLDGMRTPLLNEKMQMTGKTITTKDEAADYITRFMEPGTHNPDIHSFRAAISLVAMYDRTLPGVEDDRLKYYHNAALSHRSRTQALYANNTFNITPIQTPTRMPTNALSNLQCPMIVVHGANDKLIKTQHVRAVTELAMVERWSPNNKLLSYYEIPSCGHLFMYDNPEAFQELYTRALQEQVMKKRGNGNRSKL